MIASFPNGGVDEEGPLQKYLPYLNIGICIMLAIASWRTKGRTDAPGGLFLFLLLPGLTLGAVTGAKSSMQNVEQGIGDLNRLRYDYKGA